MSRTYRVSLGGIQPWLIMSYGNLTSMHLRYTAQPTHYSLFWLEHAGTLSINNRPIEYEAGSTAFVIPGMKYEFSRIGPETLHVQFTFDLIAKSEIVSVPAVATYGDERAMRLQEVQSSIDWLGVSTMRGLACVLNLLWSTASPATSATKSEIVYAVEDLISQRLQSKINIANLAHELAISHAHLLRLFREEHGTTIQEYLRSQRAERARHLIVSTNLPLKEIAILTGMADLQYFNKIVRAETGLSPRLLRAQANNRETA